MKLYLVKFYDIIDREGYSRSDRYVGVFDSVEKAQEVIDSYRRSPGLQFKHAITLFHLNEIFPGGAPITEKKKSAEVCRETMAKLGYARVSTNQGKY